MDVKDTDSEKLIEFINDILAEENIDIRSIDKIASIDIKIMKSNFRFGSKFKLRYCFRAEIAKLNINMKVVIL